LISSWKDPNKGIRRRFSILKGSRLKKVLKRLLDEKEFLSEYGIRALSKAHKDEPFILNHDHNSYSVHYSPAESDSGMFGGNSNWRGPIWFPVNYLLLESLYKFHSYYGDDFKVEYPTDSGVFYNLRQIADLISQRLINIFSLNEKGERAVFGEDQLFQKNPDFRDNILFYEYFHGDNGRGIGASHQTGWTGLVADLIHRKYKQGNY